MTDSKESKVNANKDQGKEKETLLDIVDEASIESFPASDPPAWIFKKPEAVTPSQILMAEHQIILQVIGALDGMIAMLKNQKRIEVAIFKALVQFMQGFVDKCHHAKEENILFPILAQHGVPATGCPLGALEHEHAHGRKLAAELIKASEKYTDEASTNIGKIIDILTEMREFYNNHIWKEDNLAFPLIDKFLSEETQKQLVKQFEEVEKDLGNKIHDRAATFAKEFSQQFKQGKEIDLIGSYYKCGSCYKLAPKLTLYMMEVSDYIWHFCGKECYEKWQKFEENESDTASLLKDPTQILDKPVSKLIRQYPFLPKLLEELNIDYSCNRDISLKESCKQQHIQPTVLINKIIAALVASQNNQCKRVVEKDHE